MFPFTPLQRALILAAGIASILWAMWSALRALHPHWRKLGWDCYVRIGMVVFLLAIGLQFIGVAEEWDFFTRNPKHILLLPGTGFAACLLVLLPATIVEERRKRSRPTRPGQLVFTMSDESVIRIAAAYLGLLVVILPLMVFGLYGQLFGPPWTFFIGTVGFASAMGVFGFSRAEIGKRFLRICARGLSERFPALRRLEIPLRHSMKIVGVIATIGLVTLVTSARLDGVAGTPVFARRAHYALVNHSVPTKVSRLRYCLAGTGFHVAWYFGASYAILLAMNALMLARIPNPKDV